MGRGATGFEVDWMRRGILIPHGKQPRRFWSCWLKRALAPHEREMAMPHQPIAVIDLELEAEAIPPDRA